jgi:hypothetical protein
MFILTQIAETDDHPTSNFKKIAYFFAETWAKLPKIMFTVLAEAPMEKWH